MGSKLDKEFEEAFKISSTTNKKLPPDVMLQLYAYYKQATKGSNYVFHRPSGNEDLRNAFKLNAWFQCTHLTEDEAKEAYINLVKKYLNS